MTATLDDCPRRGASHDRLGPTTLLPRVGGAARLLAIAATLGVPLTGGFVSKWYLISAALEKDRIWVAVVTLLSSLLAVAYVLVHGVSGRINLAFGAFSIWAGYITINVALAAMLLARGGAPTHGDPYAAQPERCPCA